MSYDPVPGMRVVCVCRFDTSRAMGGERLPEPGYVYTVRDCRAFDPSIGLHLREIVNSPRDYGGFGFFESEVYFDAAGFKPVDEDRLDLFRAMLKKAPAPMDRVSA